MARKFADLPMFNSLETMVVDIYLYNFNLNKFKQLESHCPLFTYKKQLIVHSYVPLAKLVNITPVNHTYNWSSWAL